MPTDIYIYTPELGAVERSPADVMAIPPRASLISAEDWAAMWESVGDEAELITELGVEDARTDD